MTRLITIN